jgi:hypothetical protein
MLRLIYKSLIYLHPGKFRRRFKAEMLCVFDEAVDSIGGGPLLLDAMLSLTRQWLLRSGLWKAFGASAIAMIEIVLCFEIFQPSRMARTVLASGAHIDAAAVTNPPTALILLLQAAVLITGLILIACLGLKSGFPEDRFCSKTAKKSQMVFLHGAIADK